MCEYPLTITFHHLLQHKLVASTLTMLVTSIHIPNFTKNFFVQWSFSNLATVFLLKFSPFLTVRIYTWLCEWRYFIFLLGCTCTCVCTNRPHLKGTPYITHMGGCFIDNIQASYHTLMYEMGTQEYTPQICVYSK